MMFFFIFFILFISLSMNRKHVLMNLIILEFMVVNLLMVLFLSTMSFCSSMYLYMMIFIIYMCEGSLGLTLIVLLIRYHSNDYLNSMFMW